MKSDKQYFWAREEISRIPKDTLVNEMKKRSITNEQWQNFLDGKLHVGSGKDPKTGETCAVCGGS